MPRNMDRSSALVVQDDDSTAFAIRCMLNRCGFWDVCEVRTAKEALDAAAAIRPRLIVIDLALSGQLGLRLVPALHAAAPGAAVFIVSAFPRLREPALYAGAAELVDFEDPRILERQLHRLDPRPPHACRCGSG